jgi:hypothetical protein
MMGLSSTGFMIALGVLAILVLMLVMKLFTTKPKRAEKWEKAEIMKQLLALSEEEEKRRLAAPVTRAKAQPVRPAARSTPATVKASAKPSPKVAIPVRAKAR